MSTLLQSTSAFILQPVLVTLETTVAEAIAQMSGLSPCGQAQTTLPFPTDRPSSSCVLVVDNEQVVGIFTERDVVRLVAQQQPLDRLVIQQVMSHPVIRLRASSFTDPVLALQQLQQQHICHLPIVDDQNRPLGVVTHASLGQAGQAAGDRLHSTISELVLLEAQLEAQNAILARIARGEPLPDVLNMLLQQIEQNLEGALCSILLVDEEQRLRHGAALQLPNAYMQAVDGIKIGEAVGSCGTAAFRQQTVVVADIANDRLWANYKQLALSHGLRACWSTPIVASDRRVLGTFAVYYRTVRSPQPEEIAVITKVANLAGIALERQRAETALRNSEAQYRRIVETVNEGIWIMDADSKTTFVNPKMADMLGYEISEMLGQPLLSFMDEEGRAIATTQLERRKQGIEEQHDFRFKTKTGQDVWMLLATTPLYDDAGNYIGALAMLTDISERVRIENDREQAEKQLRNVSNRLNLAVQSARIGIWEWDIVNDRLLWDDRMYELYGMQRSEVAEIYTTWETRVHPDDLEACRGTIQQAIASGQQFEIEFRVILPDGTIRYIQSYALCERDSGGCPLRLVGMNLDISAAKQREAERKQAELALQQLNEELEQRVQQRTQELLRSEQDLRTIFNNVHDAIFIHQLDGTILDVNDRALELHQATREQLLASTIADLSAPDAPLDRLPVIFKRVRSGETMRFEWKDRRFSDNSTFDAEVSLQLTVLGNQYVFIAGVRDISVAKRREAERKRMEYERRQAEKKLRESQQFIQTVLDTAPLPMFWKDRNSVFLGCNQQFANIFGLNATSEIVGRTDFEFSPTTTEATAYQADDQSVMRTGIAKLGIEETITLPNGEQRWLETHKAPLRDWTGEVVGVVGMFQDITDRKQIETALRQSEEHLRASLEEKNVLLQEVHHRVKNNLQMVSSLLRLQANTTSEPEVLGLLQESQNRVRSMALIHEKLYQSSNLARIDFAEYVQDLVEHLSKTYTTTASHIQIEIDVDSVEIDVQIANPLGLILNELLTNALKYAFPDRQAGTVSIQFHCTAPYQYSLKLADTGIGLPQELDISTTQSLGLKLVYILTKQLKGTLEIDRQQGTGFALTFVALQ